MAVHLPSTRQSPVRSALAVTAIVEAEVAGDRCDPCKIPHGIVQPPNVRAQLRGHGRSLFAAERSFQRCFVPLKEASWPDEAKEGVSKRYHCIEEGRGVGMKALPVSENAERAQGVILMTLM